MQLKPFKNNTMKAIVTNVKKHSGYSQYNGYTFEVKEVLYSNIALRIPSHLDIDRLDTVDFSFSEVFIIDIHKELDNAAGDLRLSQRLNEYCKSKGLDTLSVLNMGKRLKECK